MYHPIVKAALQRIPEQRIILSNKTKDSTISKLIGLFTWRMYVIHVAG